MLNPTWQRFIKMYKTIIPAISKCVKVEGYDRYTTNEDYTIYVSEPLTDEILDRIYDEVFKTLQAKGYLVEICEKDPNFGGATTINCLHEKTLDKDYYGFLPEIDIYICIEDHYDDDYILWDNDIRHDPDYEGYDEYYAWLKANKLRNSNKNYCKWYNEAHPVNNLHMEIVYAE